MAGVLVFGELREGALSSGARESVAAGRQLVGTAGGGVSAVVVGTDVQGAAKDLIASGADTVYTAEGGGLANYQPDAYVRAVLAAEEKASPRIILMGHTDSAKDLAPKVAFRLSAGLTMDAVEISDSDGKLVVTKPVYGGNAQATYETAADVQMATLRPKAVEALAPDSSRQGEITPLDVDLDPAGLKVKVLEVKKEQSTGVRLEDAPVVVSGGRGFGGPEPFVHLDELAEILGGAVGASRAVCDAGWMPHSIQVGLTGKTVTPDLYIAVAISGASQHLAGMTGSKTIVSINKDRDCNMFKEARFGVVGAWEEVLPAFIEMCRELKG